MVVAWVRVLAWLPWLAPDSFLALSSVLEDTHQPLRTEHLPCRPRSVTVQEWLEDRDSSLLYTGHIERLLPHHGRPQLQPLPLLLPGLGLGSQPLPQFAVQIEDSLVEGENPEEDESLEAVSDHEAENDDLIIKSTIKMNSHQYAGLLDETPVRSEHDEYSKNPGDAKN